eukprot:PhF_6_TR15620/c0_g1_i4/m.24237
MSINQTIRPRRPQDLESNESSSRRTSAQIPLGAIVVDIPPGLTYSRVDLRLGPRGVTMRPGQTGRILIDTSNHNSPLVVQVFDLVTGTSTNTATNHTATFQTGTQYLSTVSAIPKGGMMSPVITESVGGLILKIKVEPSSNLPEQLQLDPSVYPLTSMASSVTPKLGLADNELIRVDKIEKNLYQLLERVMKIDDSMKVYSADMHTLQSQFEGVLLNQERTGGVVAEHSQHISYIVDQIKVLQERQSLLMVSRTKKIIMALYTPLVCFVKGLWVVGYMVTSTILALSIVSYFVNGSAHSSSNSGSNGEGGSFPAAQKPSN